MKKEAEANSVEDNKKKEKIEKLNQADALMFQTEKQIKEFGDKLDDNDKSRLENNIKELKTLDIKDVHFFNGEIFITYSYKKKEDCNFLRIANASSLFFGFEIIAPFKSITLSAPSTIFSGFFSLTLFAFSSARFLDIISGVAFSLSIDSLIWFSSTLDGITSLLIPF